MAKHEKREPNCGECEDRWFCTVNPKECDSYPDEPIQTNADRIRAMSDEELKEFLCKITVCSVCSWGGYSGCELMDWLQQPVKESDYEHL